MFGYVLIGNHVHGKSSKVALGLAILHKIGKCPPLPLPPGTDKVLKCPAVAKGMGRAGID